MSSNYTVDLYVDLWTPSAPGFRSVRIKFVTCNRFKRIEGGIEGVTSS